ncbi:tetratricopeptide repeat protein, partial [Acinetobacter baumannii]|uniref:tetratricopeptide repeat protein n=1 Tax=Acinetobacter baumannii TaxID=470 RepID=UPI003D6A7E64
NIGVVHVKQGEYDRALEGFRKALEIRRAVYGERHPEVGTCYNNIGAVHDSQGEYARALECYRKALEIWRAVHGERHP